MRENVWESWTRKNFDVDRYIYHYTSFETAIKIIYNDTLLLSTLSRTNDTSEQKLRINCDKFKDGLSQEQISLFEKYWEDWSINSKLICFSRDRKKEDITMSFKTDPFDMTGRGFALPRMWAQYARNNSGVCFVISRDEFERKVLELYPEAICKNVKYYHWVNRLELSENTVNELVKIINHNPDTEYAQTFLRENVEFADYLFFSKLSDWEGENEYRVLVPNSKDKTFFVDGIYDCLKGIVVGEKMDEAQLRAIISLMSSSIPVRKVSFQLHRCSVSNVGNRI